MIDDNMYLYLKDLQKQGIELRNPLGEFISKVYEFVTLRYNRDFNKYEIEDKPLYPYFDPIRARRKAKQLEEVANICEGINEHLKNGNAYGRTKS